MKCCLKTLFVFLLLAPAVWADSVNPVVAPRTERPWLGKDFWSNPAEDWSLRDGRLENRFSGGNRSVVILTGEVTADEGSMTIRTVIDQISFETRGTGYVGFELGRQGPSGDYRDSAIYGAGLAAGVDFDGRPFIGDPDEDTESIAMPLKNLHLEFKADPSDNGLYDCTIRASDGAGRELGKARRTVHGTHLEGLVALMATTRMPEKQALTLPRKGPGTPIDQKRGNEGRFAFSSVELDGTKVRARPERAFGPILWTTYTMDNRGTVRLLVQGAPFSRTSKHELTLTLAGRDPIVTFMEPNSRTARFRVLNVPTDKDSPFTVTLAGESWAGTIRAIPKSGDVVLAALSCNNAAGFPHNDLVANVTAQAPDIVSFHGDQIYEKIGGYGLIYDQLANDRALQSYLRKFAMHGWTWRELLRDTPSITIPDDHDVFHGNLWGAGGGPSDVSKGYGNSSQDSGGYKMSVEFVNAVHRSQTGSLPEPADPAPCRSGMSVYFTQLAFGPLDIAVLADRQFKSAPRDLFPAAQIENGWPANLRWDPVKEASHPDAELLGPRQEAFLRRWVRKPAEGQRFRVAISQSPWLAPKTLPKNIHHDKYVPGLPMYKPGEYAPEDEPKPDFDTNGWPKPKRDLALELLKEAGALHVTGDQHLGTTGQYGLKGHNDGPWWISTPATANTFPRRWMPSEPGKNRRGGDPKWLGEFSDAFGNPFNMHAVANPYDIDRAPARLFDRAVGYSVITFSPSTGHATLANWPYWASPAKPAPDNAPYPGWPVVIDPKSGTRIR